jgi:tetratricopeptide (TPR) repeat protein
MTKVGLLKFFFLFFVVSTSFGQKVKYKDIFALLNAKQYEQAEPFLRKYLKENDDNPNAFLFMGMTFQEKSSKTDILKATRVATSQMDTAIFFYDKTLKLLTDK